MISTQQTHKENPQLKSHCDIEDREMPVLEKIDFVLPAQSVQPAQLNIFPSTVTLPPIAPLSGLLDLHEIKGELENIDSHVFQSRSSSVGGPQLEINCSVDHKRDKQYIVLDKLYRTMDKPYSTSTIDDVKRYSIVHKPSYNVDNKLYSRDNRPYSVSNKLYSVENEPYSIQNAACRPNSSRPFSPQTFSSAQGNETPQDNKTPQIKETQKRSIYNPMWSGVTKVLPEDITKWTVDNVVVFLGCLEGCTEYEGEYQKVGPKTWR